MFLWSKTLQRPLEYARFPDCLSRPGRPTTQYSPRARLEEAMLLGWSPSRDLSSLSTGGSYSRPRSSRHRPWSQSSHTVAPAPHSPALGGVGLGIKLRKPRGWDIGLKAWRQGYSPLYINSFTLHTELGMAWNPGQTVAMPGTADELGTAVMLRDSHQAGDSSHTGYCVCWDGACQEQPRPSGDLKPCCSAWQTTAVSKAQDSASSRGQVKGHQEAHSHRDRRILHLQGTG